MDNSTSKCPICFRRFTTTAQLNKHSAVHANKTFTCDFDGKFFNTKDKLRLHIFQHRKHFKLTCNACGKEYRTNQAIRKHLRTHFLKHQCQICGQIFNYKRLLLNHIGSIHEDVQNIPCKYCTRLFSNTTTRDSHIKLIHKDQQVNTGKFRCLECDIGFEMREELRIHSFIHFEGEIHHCLDCGQIFKKKKLLQHHMKMHERPNFACEICHTLFKYKTNLMKHKRMGKCEKRIEKASVEIDAEKIARIAKEQLLDITKNFSRRAMIEGDGEKINIERRKRKVKVNIEVENERTKRKFKKIEKLPKINQETSNFDENPLNIVQKNLSKTVKSDEKSTNCKRSYTYRRPYRLHRSISSTYQCDLCDFNAHHKSKLLSHIRHHISSHRHNCIYCDETFASVEKLHKHSLKVHHKGVYGSVEYSKMSFKCEICQKTFSAERIETHVELHRMEKLQCDQCGSTFRTKLAIERHMRRHEERKYACQTCGKSFKKISLRQHEQTHNPVKLYVKCEICSKLLQMKNLKLHSELQHGDRYKEKDFICECGKAFRYQKQLQKHIEQVHDKKYIGRVYRCVECDFVTTRISDLRKHSFEHYQGPVFCCEKCDLKFTTRKLLQIHSKVHLDKELRKYPCTQCGSVFQTSGGRRKHELKVHAIEEVVEVRIEHLTVV